jgi:hypothetical protein
VRSYTDGLRAQLAGTGVTVATLHPGSVRTEFLQLAGMDEAAFAAAFPKFLWMPSRDIAKAGIDALEHDRASVIPGLPSRITTQLAQRLQHRLLLPLLAKQYPGLRRDRRSAGRRPPPHPTLDGQRESVAQRADAAIPADGDQQFDALLIVEPEPQRLPRRIGPGSGLFELVDRADEHPLGVAPPWIDPGDQRVELVVGNARDGPPERRLTAPLVAAPDECAYRRIARVRTRGGGFVSTYSASPNLRSLAASAGCRCKHRTSSSGSYVRSGWPQLVMPAASSSLHGGASGVTRVMRGAPAWAAGRGSACRAARRLARRARR